MNLLKLEQVMRKTAMSRSSIYTALKDGSFPKSVPVGVRGVAWVDIEIDDYIARQIAKRDDPATLQGKQKKRAHTQKMAAQSVAKRTEKRAA